MDNAFIKRRAFCGVLLGLFWALGLQAREWPLIPIPLEVCALAGEYVFQEQEQIVAESGVPAYLVAELQQIVLNRTGKRAVLATQGAVQAFYLQWDEALENAEAYNLEVSPQSVCIRAKGEAGLFYGLQTLDQLLIGDGGTGVCAGLKAVKIVDKPRYAYRALMLDPARHFIPLEEVKRYIDRMARYKLNVLQLHLTDDQGWRIEIRKYPLLTQKGAFRNEKSGNNGPDNGYYTQQQIRELISYAARKQVEIVPELDIPGHTVAAIVAYPELGCRHRNEEKIDFGKTTDRTICAGNPQVYEFWKNILNEVCELFPSGRVHLGGDEAVIDKNWAECSRCRDLMDEKGYKEVRELMGYFFGRMDEFVKDNGKELLLWCELDNIRMPAHDFLFDYPVGCTLFTWRMGLTPKVIELTRKAGISLIAAPGEHCYFDYPQWTEDFPEYNNWGMPMLTLRAAYAFDPGYGLPAEEQRHIVGVAGLMWGEAMRNIDRVFYMTYPRALALAESGWSMMEKRNWDSFQQRLWPVLADMMREGVNFRVPFEIVKTKD